MGGARHRVLGDARATARRSATRSRQSRPGAVAITAMRSRAATLPCPAPARAPPPRSRRPPGSRARRGLRGAARRGPAPPRRLEPSAGSGGREGKSRASRSPSRGHPQRPALRAEVDLRPPVLDLVEDHPGRGERRVTAQVHLVGRGHPADLEVALLADEEGRLREVVLGGDRLHRRVGQPAVERHDRGRVAGEGPARESIDLDTCAASWSPPRGQVLNCALRGAHERFET